MIKAILWIDMLKNANFYIFQQWILIQKGLGFVEDFCNVFLYKQL